MKSSKILSCVLACAMVASMGIISVADGFSPDFPETSIANMSGVNQQSFELVDHTQEINDDGTVTNTYTYVERNSDGLSAYSTTQGTDNFIKTSQVTLWGDGQLVCEYYVKGTYDWNSVTNKVYVSNVSGGFNYKNNSTYSKTSTTTSGNGTSKASATFSFTKTTTLGSVTNHSVKASCTSKGTNS